MARMKFDIGTMAVVVLVLGGLVLVGSGTIPLNFGQSVVTDDGSGGGDVFTSAATVRASARDLLAGTVPANIDARLIDSDGRTNIGTAVDLTAQGTAVTTAAPNNLNGFLWLGNDNYLAGGTSGFTDRGAEYYFQSIPVSYSNRNSYDIPEAKTCLEGSITYSALRDAGTGELEDDTFSVAVGSGATVDTTTITVSVGTADSCLGNPAVQYPLAYCFNTTATGNSIWDEVRPLNFAGTIPVPKFLAGNNILGGVCYQLPTKLLDGTAPGTTTAYEWGLRLRAKSGADPTAASNITGIPLDSCMYVEESTNRLVDAYGIDTVIVAAEDCGFDSRTAGNTVNIGVS